MFEEFGSLCRSIDDQEFDDLVYGGQYIDFPPDQLKMLKTRISRAASLQNPRALSSGAQQDDAEPSSQPEAARGAAP